MQLPTSVPLSLLSELRLDNLYAQMKVNNFFVFNMIMPFHRAYSLWYMTEQG